MSLLVTIISDFCICYVMHFASMTLQLRDRSITFHERAIHATIAKNGNANKNNHGKHANPKRNDAILAALATTKATKM